MKNVTLIDGVYWVSQCPLLNYVGRRAISNCLACPEVSCLQKENLAELLLTKEIKPDDPIFDYTRVSGKGSASMSLCPLKNRVGKICDANRHYCKYNHACTRRVFAGNTRVFVLAEVPMKLLLRKNKNSVELVDFNGRIEDFTALDGVISVSKITKSIKVKLELVPANESGQAITSNVETFIKNLTGEFIDGKGAAIDIKAWAEKAKPEDEIFLATNKYVPMRKLVATNLEQPAAPKPAAPKPASTPSNAKPAEPKPAAPKA